MNLIDYFDAGARQHRNAPCFVGPDGKTLSYFNVQSLTCRISSGLRQRGLAKGFHAAVFGSNDPDAFVAVLAIARAGGVWLPVNSRNAAAANVAFLKDMDCSVLFYQKRCAEQVEEIRRTVRSIRLFVCLDEGQGPDMSISGLIDGQPDDFHSPDWDPDALALIMGTGGTTGISKGVMLSNRNISMFCANQMSTVAVTHRMNYLAAAPITHTAGVMALPFMARGARVILMDGVEPQRLLRTLESERVDVLFLPPTAIYALLSQPNVRAFDYSALKYFLYGAAPMSPDKLAEALEVFGPVMMQNYGQSEVPATISVLLREDHFANGAVAPRQRLLSAGRPFPLTRVAIMDGDGRLLDQPRAVGEIVAQGDLVMKGYYKNPSATAEATCNGWHRTGDVGYFDDEGFLYIVDRKKDMIISGGFNVYSSEVEAALMAHPSVKDCAVIGVPDEKWGEAVKGVVEFRAGLDVPATDLIDFVRQQLGSVKAPKSIDVVQQLPRSSVGKVLKRRLREPYWADRDRAV